MVIKWWIGCESSYTFYPDKGYLEPVCIDITEQKRAALEREIGAQRYRNLFDAADVCLWDEDFSALYEKLAQLRSAGVTDLRSYLRDNPDAVWSLAGKIKVNHHGSRP